MKNQNGKIDKKKYTIIGIVILILYVLFQLLFTNIVFSGDFLFFLYEFYSIFMVLFLIVILISPFIFFVLYFKKKEIIFLISGIALIIFFGLIWIVLPFIRDSYESDCGDCDIITKE